MPPTSVSASTARLTGFTRITLPLPSIWAHTDPDPTARWLTLNGWPDALSRTLVTASTAGLTRARPPSPPTKTMPSRTAIADAFPTWASMLAMTWPLTRSTR